METMKCAKVVEPYKVEIQEIEKPKIGDNDVLVKISYAGVCGSDLHLFKGIHAFRRLPCILGHENAGVVYEVGKNVTRVKVGDRVTCNPQVLCGECEPCKSGLSNLCDHRKAPGTGDWIGTFVEYFPAPEETVYKLDDHISFKAAVMTEPLAISHHLLKLGHVKNPKTLAILGSGTVGMTTLFLAKRMGIEKVICTDISEGSLELAKSFGADVTIQPLRDMPWKEEGQYKVYDPEKDPVVAAAREMTDGLGVDLCVVSGVSDYILDQAAQVTRKGGDICLASMITKPLPFRSYEFARREEYLYGTLVYTTKEYEETVDIVNSCRTEELEKFITQVYPFDNTQGALDALNAKKTPVLKILVELVKE